MDAFVCQEVQKVVDAVVDAVVETVEKKGQDFLNAVAAGIVAGAGAVTGAFIDGVLSIFGAEPRDPEDGNEPPPSRGDIQAVSH
jgi:hypothetical protein